MRHVSPCVPQCAASNAKNRTSLGRAVREIIARNRVFYGIFVRTCGQKSEKLPVFRDYLANGSSDFDAVFSVSRAPLSRVEQKKPHRNRTSRSRENLTKPAFLRDFVRTPIVLLFEALLRPSLPMLCGGELLGTDGSCRDASYRTGRLYLPSKYRFPVVLTLTLCLAATDAELSSYGSRTSMRSPRCTRSSVESSRSVVSSLDLEI